MAVEAVVSVVIQKVTDLQIQESKIFNKVVDRVEDIRLELRQMRGFLTDAEERQKDDDDAKKWVGNYLNTLHKVEDMVESYVLKLVHKKMKDSTITACWKLRRKLKQIEDEVKELNKNRPDNIEDASLRKLSFRREQKQQLVHDIYADLPAHYKLCLLYLTLFPREFDLSVRKILRLWLAEGFLQRSSGLGEDLAEKCFDDLVRRNLIKISKFRSDGGPKKCRLPGNLHEQLSPKAEEIGLFHNHPMSAKQRQPPSNKNNKNDMETSTAEPSILRVRRIVEYADITDTDFDSDFQNLRSYFSFNCTRYDTPAKGVGNFLRRIIGSKGFGLLRVLDLEGVYKPILPTTLKHLFQLRYLGLRWTFLDNLPESVGDLPYLETLDLKRTYINNLPSSVWKLKHLRHLNLPQVRLDMRMQPSKKLLTLWGIIIDDGCNMENGLEQVKDLRELGITCCQLTHFVNLLNWIKSQTHLQSLSLTSKNEMGCPSRLELESLSELHKITHLKLLGKLRRLLNKDEFPPYLRVLTLSVSNLNDDPMGILSQLQYLSVLRLLAESYRGQTMQCPENGFVNLRVLKLWMLNNLEKWEVMPGGMPNIKELEIRSCQQLKELPDKFLERTTLKELILTNMPEDFEQKVRESIFDHTNLQTNHYEIKPLPWEKNPELWQPDCSINL